MVAVVVVVIGCLALYVDVDSETGPAVWLGSGGFRMGLWG